MRPAWPYALATGLVLADSSVVTLALPEILRELDTSVAGVAWVLIAFNLALALAAVPAARAGGSGAFLWGLGAFAAASAVCAFAGSLGVLVAARAAQGLAGAVAVGAALALLREGRSRGRAVGVWGAAGVVGAAIGPAAGGALTDAFSWEAMFALQVPTAVAALLGGVAAEGRAGEEQPAEAPAARPARPGLAGLAALGLVSAGLSAALFLLVLMLIEGWRLSPLAAAATVTVMPAAAVVAEWLAGRAPRAPRAAAGCVLLAGGLTALALLPGASPAWTIGPQVLIGAGLGLSLSALTLGSVEDGPLVRRGQWTIAARHAGIVAGLLALTPIFTADLEAARERAEQAGLARVLDAPLALDTKLRLTAGLVDRLEEADQRIPELAPAFRGVEAEGGERAALTGLQAELVDQLDRAGTEAFATAFLAAAGLALLGLLPALAWHARPARGVAGAVAGAAVAAGALIGGQVALGGGDYEPATPADPCAERALPGGAAGEAQRAILVTLDGAACELGVTREALLLAVAQGERPAGASDQELEDALAAGVRRAGDAGRIPLPAELGLLTLLRSGGPGALLGLLLGDR